MPRQDGTAENAKAVSIYEAFRRHPTKRVLVEPLLWRRLHLEILSCTFGICYPAPQTMMVLPTTEARRLQRMERFFLGPENGSAEAKEGHLRWVLCLEP
ncbi:hypothetical protein XA68_17653 [Ophiocordyceps unilateralis]|uniref:Uncharacterized protein n=1 Tax=Ophiocordyceps unilateralis TaxID=268505 RepID=A0A2A9P2W3_OPHUN|nr:hypothetical protein XA68_17653 [Ophiocordyceps unilateralis]